MLLLLLLLLAPAAAPGAGSPSGPGDPPAVVPRRRPSGQCRVLGLSPLLAPERSATPPGARGARTGRTTTGAESPSSRESARDSGERSAEPPRDGSSSRAPRRLDREGRGGEVRAGPFFSAARTLDLRLGAAVRSPAPGDARVELRLYTPKGHLYQTLRVTAVTTTRTSRDAGGGAREARSAWPLEATLPVAGTAVVNHSLYGRWTVEPYLEGHSDPCGPSLQFWIDP
jgi:hypothetical protein